MNEFTFLYPFYKYKQIKFIMFNSNSLHIKIFNMIKHQKILAIAILITLACSLTLKE